MNEQDYRKAKRSGDVRLMRKLREGTAVVETVDPPELPLDAPSEETPAEQEA